MSINLDFSKNKVSASYKTIYLRNNVIDLLEKIAEKNNTSFNNVISSMVDYCLKEGHFDF